MWNRRNSLEFTLIQTVPVAEKFYGDELKWFSVRDEKFQGFHGTGEEMLRGFTGKSFDLDIENYTYIVTIGHELESLKFSLSAIKNTFPPKQFVGIITPKEERADLIYIYRIKKMDIDYDYHDPSGFVTFV